MYWRRPAPMISSSPFARDKIKAYIWGRIAMNNGEPMESFVRTLAMGMTAAEHSEAQELEDHWLHSPSDCEQGTQ